MYLCEVDYILSNQPKWFQNIEAITTTFPSDHKLVRGTLMLQHNKKSRITYNKLPKTLLKTDNEISTYIESLEHLKKDLLNYNITTTSVQNYHDAIVNAIEQSLEKAHTGRKEQSGNSIITHHIKNLIKRRHELQNTKPKTSIMKKELSALYKLTSKYIKKYYKKPQT